MVRFIVFGRSGIHSHNEFHQEFLNQVRGRFVEYRNCRTHEEKRRLVQQVIAWVEESDGVFARKNPETGVLEIVSDAQEIYHKVSQAFRGRRNRTQVAVENNEDELDADLDDMEDLMLSEDDMAEENRNEESQWLAELSDQDETDDETEVGVDLMDLSIGTFPVSSFSDGGDDESIATNSFDEDDEGGNAVYCTFTF